MVLVDSRGGLSKEFDEALTVQDRLRLKLNEFGQKNIQITIEELASQMSLSSNSVYQALHRLRQYGEVELEKTELSNGKEKIVGITIRKLEPSNRTYRRVAERSGRVKRVKPVVIPDINSDQVEIVDGVPILPETTDYLNKKLAVEQMKERAKEAGLDPSVIAFTPTPLAEEAVILLKLYMELRTEYRTTKEALRQTEFDLEAEKRNVTFYKNKVQEQTQKELREHAKSH